MESTCFNLLAELRIVLLNKINVMGKQRYLKIPIPKWNWWQTTIAVFIFIIAYKSDADGKVINLLKEIIKLLSG